ncbi:MAG: hypothetical protein A3J53_03460 [Candidatus Harrisonbacteria bacterium RIFCSPHIGHO2_02_FULL_40_20]|nr:MAG: hypothetical protein A3J53_03460 [Candidatus Harrisonbacteria bacterium RIFCSPHIGHO2_02_FULL_40_20]
MNTNLVQWVLKIAVAGEFLGHGVFALQGRTAWVEWFSIFGISDVQTATTLLWLIGLTDILLAILILVKPIRLALLWMAFWGFWTALMRPIAGDSIFEFVERWANWGAPLALLLLLGWPKTGKEWLK